MKVLKKAQTIIYVASVLATSTFITKETIAQNSTDILFGIVPQQAASRLAQVWVPFLRQLSAETGLKVKFATMKDIPTFEKCLAQGAFEVAYMNPYHYTVFSKVSGYQAFARQVDKRLQGIIIARKNSVKNIKTLADLDGQKLAFPSPAAFGASVLPRAELGAQGIKFTPNYVKSHDSVYRSVAAGIFPAGGGVKRTFGNISEKLKKQLRIIHLTKKYTPHAFASSSKLSQDVRQKISNGMLAIAQNHLHLLKPLGMKGFQTATDSDWDDVRALGLTPDETKIASQGNAKCRSD